MRYPVYFFILMSTFFYLTGKPIHPTPEEFSTASLPVDAEPLISGTRFASHSTPDGHFNRSKKTRPLNSLNLASRGTLFVPKNRWNSQGFADQIAPTKWASKRTLPLDAANGRKRPSIIAAPLPHLVPVVRQMNVTGGKSRHASQKHLSAGKQKRLSQMETEHTGVRWRTTALRPSLATRLPTGAQKPTQTGKPAASDKSQRVKKQAVDRIAALDKRRAKKTRTRKRLNKKPLTQKKLAKKKLAKKKLAKKKLDWTIFGNGRKVAALQMPADARGDSSWTRQDPRRRSDHLVSLDPEVGLRSETTNFLGVEPSKSAKQIEKKRKAAQERLAKRKLKARASKKKRALRKAKKRRYAGRRAFGKRPYGIGSRAKKRKARKKYASYRKRRKKAFGFSTVDGTTSLYGN